MPFDEQGNFFSDTGDLLIPASAFGGVPAETRNLAAPTNLLAAPEPDRTAGDIPDPNTIPLGGGATLEVGDPQPIPTPRPIPTFQEQAEADRRGAFGAPPEGEERFERISREHRQDDSLRRQAQDVHKNDLLQKDLDEKFGHGKFVVDRETGEVDRAQQGNIQKPVILHTGEILSHDEAVQRGLVKSKEQIEAAQRQVQREAPERQRFADDRDRDTAARKAAEEQERINRSAAEGEARKQERKARAKHERERVLHRVDAVSRMVREAHLGRDRAGFQGLVSDTGATLFKGR